jgi:hypothetical protein
MKNIRNPLKTPLKDRKNCGRKTKRKMVEEVMEFKTRNLQEASKPLVYKRE